VGLSLTTLVGREQDVARVVELLRDPHVRLLTISGPGGVGKTRFAHAVVAEVADDFADGVIFVPLDSLTDQALVIPTLARAVAGRGRQDEPLEGLKADLANQRSLLVLDTFEQVVDAAPSLVELLAGCPELKVAVTSRTRLRVTMEHEYSLGPLGEAAAIALFLERARAVRPDLELDRHDADAVADICARLDGLPLAIELAAARVKLLGPKAMRERLEHRLELLTAGPRDLPARQQTLRTTIDWSYRLLEESEQRLLRLLSVFVGGCTLSAVEAVCGANLDTLGSLVDKSLVMTDGERYAMLDTIREYAAGLLAEGGDEGKARKAHASHYLDLAVRAEPLLTGPDQRSWLDRLEVEHGNLRAALGFLLAREDAETALRLGVSLTGFWLERGYLSEGRRWLRDALETGADAPAVTRAKALNGAGLLAHYQGAYAQAEALCAESLTLHRGMGDQQGVASSLSTLALTARTKGDYASAEAMFAEALAIFRQLGDRQGIVRTLDRLGIAVWFEGDDGRARALLEESLTAFRELADTGGIGLSLVDLGFVALSQGDFASAQTLVAESLAVFKEVGDRRNTCKALYALGDLARARRDYRGAADCYEEGLSISVEVGDPWFSARCLEGMAALAVATGEPAWAARLFGAAEALREAIGAAIPEYFRRGLESAAAEARARLGEKAFEAELREGLRLSAEQVLTSARETAAATPSQAHLEGLTGRELDVLRLVADGMTDAQVAERLVVSLRTVHAHLRSIYRKLDVHSRSAATRYALEHGLAGSPA